MAPTTALALVIALGAILVLPGWLVLAAVGQPARGLVRAATAVGLSVVLWPVALLWSTQAGVTWSAWRVRGLLGVLALLGVVAWLRARRDAGQAGRDDRIARDATAVRVALAALLGLTIGLRIWHARQLLVPPWVDGLHHTIVTQAILDHGRLPDSLAPYLNVDVFAYHFGFHALAASVAWAAGAAAPVAVLWTGQALNAASVATVFLLARRLLRHEAAAVLAAAVPASLYWFPAYYVTWSRFTQLAGLVALPVAWLLLADATAQRRPTSWCLLAGVAAGGLCLTHYRVFALFLLGAAVWAVGLLRRPADRGRLLRTVGAAALLGALVVAPWVARAVAPGIASLHQASTTWYGAQPGAEAVPRWLFVVGWNAWVLALGGLGLVLGLRDRRPAALLLLAGLAAAVIAVHPGWLRLPTAWMLPPFALAISLFVPVALGWGLLGDGVIDRAARWVSPDRANVTVALLAVALALAGAVRMREVVNPGTVLVQPPDLVAAAWVAANTPPDARFLISTAHWHLGTYRGLDGGYWLPVLAGRATSIPAALYPYGRPADVRELSATARVAAQGDAMDDATLVNLMRRLGADHIYVGPAAADTAGKLSAARLRRHPALEETYASGGVHVFRLLHASPRAPPSAPR